MPEPMDRDALYRLEPLQPRILLSGDCLEEGTVDEMIDETPVVDVPVDDGEAPLGGGEEIFQTGIVLLEEEGAVDGSEELYQICVLPEKELELPPIEDDVFFRVGEPVEEEPRTFEPVEPVGGVIITPDEPVSEEWLYMMGTPVAAPAEVPDAAPVVEEEAGGGPDAEQAVTPTQPEALELQEDGLLSEQNDLLS